MFLKINLLRKIKLITNRIHNSTLVKWVIMPRSIHKISRIRKNPSKIINKIAFNYNGKRQHMSEAYLDFKDRLTFDYLICDDASNFDNLI